MSRRPTLLLAAVLFLQSSVGLAQAQATPTAEQATPTAEQAAPTAEQAGVSSEKLQAIPAALEEMIKAEKIAGAVVLVARNGQVVYHDAHGRRDIESDSPMQKDTLFRIYSMTKPVTSVATLMLVEQGLMRLDDPVEKHLPELKGLRVYKTKRKQTKPKRAVTVQDLLMHTSGMTYGFFSKSAVDQLYMKNHPLFSATQDQFVQKLGTLPLLYEPGHVWHYGVSTDLLGALVERVSGQSLSAFFKSRIFEPLSMHDTSFYVPDEKLERFATSYAPGLDVVDAYKTSDFRKPERLESGGGGLISTAADYLNFCQMLLDGGTFEGTRLLQAETVYAMTQNQLPPGVWAYGVFGFGLGVQVQMQNWGNKAHVGQYSWDGVASTHFWISPADGLIFIALSQRQPFSTELKDTLTPLVYKALLASD